MTTKKTDRPLEIKLTNPLEQCQLKFASDAKGEFEGYASVFGSNDQVNDTIEPGAFMKSLESGRSPRMFFNHRHGDVPLGTWVDLKEDSHGLLGRGSINMDHPLGPAIHSAMKRGDTDGLSIGFTMNDDDYTRKSDGGRVIKNMDLREISIVTFPCELNARISAVKADIEGLMTLKDYENYLRDVGGFSKSMATALVSQIVRAARGEHAKQLDEMTAKASAEARAIIEQLKSKL